MLIVYGTLIAQGNANNQIVFSAVGQPNRIRTCQHPQFILVNPDLFKGVNPVVSSPSIIQNSVLNGVNVNVNGALSSTIDACVFNVGAPYSSPIPVNGGSPQISNNIINLQRPRLPLTLSLTA